MERKFRICISFGLGFISALFLLRHNLVVPSDRQHFTPTTFDLDLEKKNYIHPPTFDYNKAEKLSPQEDVFKESKDFIQLSQTAKQRQLAQDDPLILKYLWDNYSKFLRPPKTQLSSFGYNGIDPSMGQTDVVLKLLNNMTKGFYLEVGAYDGIISSNTYVLEKKFGWKGLLIEPDPGNMKKLLKNDRNAWISHSCLSLSNYPEQVSFKPRKDQGSIKIGADQNDDDNVDLIKVQCFPIYSYLAALNIKTIDFFSLDVEGFEFKILLTIPFDKLFIKIITIEIYNSKHSEITYIEFMESKNYRLVTRFYERKRLFDLIFVHNSIVIEESILKSLGEVHGILNLNGIKQ